MSEDRGSLGNGLLTGMALTVGGMVVSGVFAWVPLWGIGIVQLLWMLPAWRIYRRRGQEETAKGILIVAGVVFLLNASCWGLMFSNKIKIGG